MTGRINLLTESVINQIAAGEVVERPTSIVKELVENSLDAKASRITISLIQGGLEGIKVVDDGEGIPPDQVALAFERHATSKILEASDLFNVNSLGFRGEALPSIASVARVVMETKIESSNYGTRIVIEGGKRISLSPVGIPTGTSVSVSKLFFNTPARKKFLKNISSERRAIADLITKLAIGNPGVAFILEADGKEILHTSGSGDLRATLATIYGSQVAKEMVAVDKGTHFGSVKGLVSLPIHARGTRGCIHLFVNSRSIESSGLIKAIELGYGSMMAPRRYPIAAIFIQIDPELVDVNVHPAKSEVRFKDDREIFKVVLDGVREGLNKALTHNRFEPSKFDTFSNIGFSSKSRKYEIHPEILWDQGDFTETVIKESAASTYLEVNPTTGEVREPQPPLVHTTYTTSFPTHLTIGVSDISEVRKGLSQAKVVGQVLNTYILIPHHRGLWMVDQHAAHERILFEKFLAMNKGKIIEAQELLIPLTVELTPQLTAIIQDLQQPFKDMGIDLEPFGGRSVLIRALPIDIQNSDESIKDVIEDLAHTWIDNRVGEREEKIAAILACKGAIKAGKYLPNEDLENLLERLANTMNPLSCPHGRPTIIEISQKELEKRFDRH